MHKPRLNSQKTKTLFASVAMAALVAIPVVAQPLGLATTYPKSGTATMNEQSALSGQESDTSLELIETMDSMDIEMNRSMPMSTEDVEAGILAASGEIDTNDLIDDEDFAGEPETIEPTPTEAVEPADPIIEVAAQTVYITKKGVNYRSEPNTTSEILGVFKMADKLTITGEMPGWKRVKSPDGREGYVAEEFISKSMVFIPKSDSVYLTKSGVNLRQDATTNSSSLGRLSTGTRLTRTGIGDGWTRVKTSSGKEGYVATNFLTTEAPAVPTPRPTTRTASKPAATTKENTEVKEEASAPSGTISQVISNAKSLLGVRYVYGSASRSGADCSGLIYYAYRNAGISVPRSSRDYASFGTKVSLSNIKAGDVVAMDTRSGDGKTMITHVGLYIGGGEMIHASSSLGKVVRTSLSRYLGYSSVKLITIRRIRG